MATILLGPLISGIAGSIGGVTFQNNASGIIARTRPVPSRHSTAKQQTAHARHSQLLREWQNLTEVQRDAWNVYAGIHTKINKFGQSKNLTGQNWFESLNYYKQFLAEPLFVLPPFHELPAAPPAFSLLLTDDNIKINITGSFLWAENGIIIWVYNPTTRSTFSLNQIKKFANITFVEPPVNPSTIRGIWETALNMEWNPAQFPDANIVVCIQSIRTSNFITSALLCASANTGTDLQTGFDFQNFDASNFL